MSLDKFPKRWEVWWVTFDPALPEKYENPPAVIVSNDIANRELNRVQVVPPTSNVARLYLVEAFVTPNGDQRKAMADQLSTIGKLRLKDTLGRLGHNDMAAIERAICLQLGLRP